MAFLIAAIRDVAPVDVSSQGFNTVLTVSFERLFDRIRVSATTPIGFDQFCLQAKLLRELLPQRGKVTGLYH